MILGYSVCEPRAFRGHHIFGVDMQLKHIKLSSEDRCAIDVVLENRAAERENGDGVSPHCFGKSNMARRVAKLENVFNLLGQMPAQDPPVNLVVKTLRFVKKHATTRPTAGGVPHPATHQNSSASMRWPSHRVLH